MTPQLHRRYAREILEASGIDPRDATTQRLIESYSPELGLDAERLRRIQRLVQRYNTMMGTGFKLRYYQVLALYFTEHFYAERSAREADARSMLAYWMATGSGKTLIMHLNVLQHLDHLDDARVDYDRLEVILTTPGVNLIAQHREEFAPFVEALNERYTDRLDLRIDTTQALLQHDLTYFNLRDDLTRRLVLVDEGHIGLSSTEEGEFKKLRDAMNRTNSFLLEYSATYHHLGSADLEREYEQAIVYDYNYARFYDDGYGKDYYFKRIGEDRGQQEGDEERSNLQECFSVLQRKFEAHRTLIHLSEDEQKQRFAEHLPLRPLIALMGGTVSSGTTKGDQAVLSDVEKVLRFLASLSSEQRAAYAHVFNGDIIGPLRLTRSRDVDDEVLLSFGDGEKWGLLNVSGGDRFFNDLELAGVEIEKRTDLIGEERYQFQHIDDPACPLNVLVGSRKFSEGWNCFRLSVIGLINLGSSKGNQIIQIFGRGVRLHGAAGEGKRAFKEHLADYYALSGSIDDEIRRLETLTVFSLKATYLKTFIDGLQEDVPPRHTLTLRVEPTCITLGDGTEVAFEDYRERLPIFKMRENEAGLVRFVIKPDGAFVYEHLTDGNPEGGEQTRFRTKLDYRTDRDTEGVNVAEDVRNRCRDLKAYLDHAGMARLLRNEADAAGLLLYAEDEADVLRPVCFEDLLPFVEELRYDEHLRSVGLERLDALRRHVARDVVRKLKNRVRYLINSQHYVFDEVPEQSTAEEKHDFLYQYVVTKEFESREALEAFAEDLEAKREEIRQQLALVSIAPHVYEPLLRDAEPSDGISISPDVLNRGEAKFVRDLSEHIRDRYAASERFEFYLLRNVETLRSIGIYLESDEKAFFPDFVLWVVDRETNHTHVVFADPKGQTGLDNPETRDASEKVLIAQKTDAHPALHNLQERLSQVRATPITLHSFILLRDSSKFGRSASQDAAWVRQHMLPYNLLRLDWHDRKEDGSTSRPLDGRTYLDIMFEQIGLAAVPSI